MQVLLLQISSVTYFYLCGFPVSGTCGLAVQGVGTACRAGFSSQYLASLIFTSVGFPFLKFVDSPRSWFRMQSNSQACPRQKCVGMQRNGAMCREHDEDWSAVVSDEVLFFVPVQLPARVRSAPVSSS